MSIRQLLAGEFHQSTEQYKPSYIASSGMRISRANVIATVISAEGNECVLDDGESKIRVTAYGSELEGIKAGDIIRLIGKIREGDGERFVAAEAAKALNDPKYLKLRKLELEARQKERKENREIEEEVEDVVPEVPKGELMLEIENMEID